MKKKSFAKWNEQMYRKHGNENRYEHPNPLIRYNTKKRMRTIVSLLASGPKDDVLDLGCGAGMELLAIKSYRSLTGVDLSATALKEAKENLQSKKSVKLMKRDAQAFRSKKKFDKIICAEVLEHLPSPSKVIDNIALVSKKGADIVITVPNEDLIDSIFRLFKALGLHKVFGKVTIKMDWHLHEFNLAKFRKLVEGKLTIIRVRRNPFWFFPLSYVVKCRIK